MIEDVGTCFFYDIFTGKSVNSSLTLMTTNLTGTNSGHSSVHFQGTANTLTAAARNIYHLPRSFYFLGMLLNIVQYMHHI